MIAAPELGRKLSIRVQELILTQLQPRRRFTLRGETYPYFAGRYNSAWHNERTIEVPIALRYLAEHREQRVLEIGNVVSHYVPISHHVVDKYERAPDVHNVDVLDFHAADPYDLILSISTLEHVGWDEDERESDKPIRALAHLASLLACQGTLLVTLPLGWNPHVDEALRTDAFAFEEVTFLKRISRDNRWREIQKPDIRTVRYGHPFPAANVLAIGMRGNGRLD